MLLRLAGNVYASSDAIGTMPRIDNIICNAERWRRHLRGQPRPITRTAFNDVWNNAGGDYFAGTNRTGIDGNISQDPQFVDAANNDYHLQDVSPCVNAGDPDFQPSPASSTSMATRDFLPGAWISAPRNTSIISGLCLTPGRISREW